MELIENEWVSNAITAAAGDRAFHAYIITGAPGTGKRTAGTLLCQALVCTAVNRSKNGPCGVCLPCRKVAKGIHPDVRTLSAGGKESFLVSQSREIRDDAVKLPNEGRHKVYVLPDAHKMNTAAANALLKILEEPPEYAAFVLITENASSLPETVRSRCMELRMRPVSEAGGAAYLEKLRPDYAPENLARAMADAEGSIGEALRILDGDTRPGVADEAAAALYRLDEYALLAALMSLERQSRGDVAEVFGVLAAKLTGAACSGRLPASSRVSAEGLFHAAEAARELRDGAKVYISAGNYLSAAAARLYTAAGTGTNEKSRNERQ